MMIGQHNAVDGSTTQEERERLVRLCTAITGQPDVAEDLAQETLLVAWRDADRLRKPDSRPAWMNGIARNLCRDWLRRQARSASLMDASGSSAESLSDVADAELDLEVELERSELATLLDRALELLPPETRQVMILRLVEDLPQREVAERLEASEGAVAVRLHRGKVALRSVLATNLRAEFEPFGIGDLDRAFWQETRLWCSRCGMRRLHGWLSPDTGDVILRCPDCFSRHGRHEVRAIVPPDLQPTRSFKVIRNRLIKHLHGYLLDGLSSDFVTCEVCGHPARVGIGVPAEEAPHLRDVRAAHVRCSSCGDASWVSLDGLVMALSEAREFFKEHPRYRTLPECSIAEIGGGPGVVVRFESVRDGARLNVIASDTDFRVLRIHKQ